MADTATLDTTTRIEHQLVDVVIVHELPPIDLPTTVFNDWTARTVWQAIQRIWARGEHPTPFNVHDEFCPTSHRTRHTCTVAADVICLPTGNPRHVDDYVAILHTAERRRQLTILLGDAAQSVAAGADPDAVLARIVELAS